MYWYLRNSLHNGSYSKVICTTDLLMNIYFLVQHWCNLCRLNSHEHSGLQIQLIFHLHPHWQRTCELHSFSSYNSFGLALFAQIKHFHIHDPLVKCRTAVLAFLKYVVTLNNICIQKQNSGFQVKAILATPISSHSHFQPKSKNLRIAGIIVLASMQWIWTHMHTKQNNVANPSHFKP